MINGIVNVRKEKGYTSHDVVAKLRGIIRQKKIGHTGTLDPDAVGVLPVCLGKATKLCDLIGGWDKSYEAVLLLGQTTDTEDCSGQILSRAPVNVTEEEIAEILRSFVGDYNQIPPMYSAKKVKGRKLYELAREGIVIERKPCPVQIKSIHVKEINLPRVTFSVTCSKGTYIRSLCRDAGEQAGCGGCMEELTRTRVADFHLTDSFTLEEIEAAREEGRLMDLVRPIDSVFMDYPAIPADPSYDKLLMNGNPIPAGDSLPVPPEDGDLVRVYNSRGLFIGVYRYDSPRKQLRPYKMFI
ncbi:MAG: tRNA pseudouridine(55) synthase TruB [Eubacterium sp.]|nr:tRNA pseudouridine(55) synthase TruB [Eubacterium sp.]